MKKNETVAVIAVAGLGVAGLLAYLAHRQAGGGPVPMTKYTELRTGPLMEHLVSLEELGCIPAKERHHYPDKVAPNVVGIMHNGFAPHYQINDPEAMDLPSEAMW